MKKLDYMLMLFLMAWCFVTWDIAHSQEVTLQACQNAQSDASLQTSNISTAQANIVNFQALLTADNALIAQCNTAFSQNVSAWNFDYDAQLEAAGCRWTTCFPLVFPNANLTAIAAQININCPVTEAQVTWTNWPAYEGIHGTSAASWKTFYCADGPAS